MTDKEMIRVLQDRLAALIADVEMWVADVDRDADWDSWDHHYKKFRYEGGLDVYRDALLQTTFGTTGPMRVAPSAPPAPPPKKY